MDSLTSLHGTVCCTFVSSNRVCRNSSDLFFSEIEVRLLNPNGGSNIGGRVEVNYEGAWGTVCGNGWDASDGEVVCRMLGYPDLRATGILGGGTGSIMLDNVNCAGGEKSLAECQHDGWEKHNCSHSMDVAVVCNNSGQVQAQGGGLTFRGVIPREWSQSIISSAASPEI